MRIIGSALVATTLFVTSAFAATDSMAPQAAPVAAQSTAGALAPGKPAGIQKAQGADNTVWWILGAGAVIAGVVLVATSTPTLDRTPAASSTH